MFHDHHRFKYVKYVGTQSDIEKIFSFHTKARIEHRTCCVMASILNISLVRVSVFQSFVTCKCSADRVGPWTDFTSRDKVDITHHLLYFLIVTVTYLHRRVPGRCW